MERSTVVGGKLPETGTLVPACALACALLLLYVPTEVWLYERFTAPDSYYSHGFIVPFVAAYLIWMRRRELESVAICSSSAGFWLCAAALAVHVVSTLAGVNFASSYSLLFLVFGLSLYLFGARYTRRITFPLLFLVFMLPLPLVAVNAVSFPLRLYATKASVFILSAFSPLAVHSEGFRIVLPNGSLTVGSPCSGLRSLISLLALGSVLAIGAGGNRGKKVLLILAAVPIALASNIFRILLLCVGACFAGSDGIQGTYHDASGYAMFLAAFAALWYTKTLLCRPGRRHGSTGGPPSAEEGTAPCTR